MAIYHCSFKNISRNEGRSAIAAAAYRSGEKLYNKWDGMEHDYTHKNWIEYTEVILPENAPDTWKNRETLWNAVECAEKARDGRLARECLIALPIELSLEDNIQLAREFAKQFVDDGMIADIAVHSPPMRDDLGRPLNRDGEVTDNPDEFFYNNPHAHILLSVRPLDEKRKWQAKTQKEYLCKRDGEERGFTAEEWKTAQLEGWEKQYRYPVMGENQSKTTKGKRAKKAEYLTPSEAEAKGFTKQDRINYTPKSTKFGRQNELTARWNSEEQLMQWRKAWEVFVNRELEKHGFQERVDCRSFEDQGITDKLPTVHIPVASYNMEKKAERLKKAGVPEGKIKHSDMGDINRYIMEYNKTIDEKKQIETTVHRKIRETAGRMERHRIRIHSNSIHGKSITASMEGLVRMAQSKQDEKEKVQETAMYAAELNEKSLELIAKLLNAVASLGPLEFSKKKYLQEQIKQEKQKIESRNQYVQSLHIEETVQKSDVDYSGLQTDIKGRESQLSTLEADTKQLEQEYQELLESVPDSFMPELQAEQKKLQKIDSEKKQSKTLVHSR